jgi:nitrous oxidase accessory protein
MERVMRLSLLLFPLCFSTAEISARELHVGDGHPFKTLQMAIDAADADDAILVHGGRHAGGGFLLNKAVRLIGMGDPILDGEFQREVLTITASRAEVRGFTIRSGGRSSTSDLSGVRVESASHVTVADNRVENCNFGITLSRANHCTVRGNTVEGRPDVEQNSGNGIHLWNCVAARVEGNTVKGHRDGIYLEFASQSSVESNVVEHNTRYGLHFMFSHGNTYRANRFERNGAGVAVMYSREVAMLDNTFAYSWGASAYGLLLKDITDSQIRGNTFHRNSTAIYAQGASRVTFERNLLRENGWALRILASGEDNVIAANSFIGNSFDVGTNGQLSKHCFDRNYWDRYEGYDLDRDGFGDVPFRPVGLFAILVERSPSSIVLVRSFMAQLLDRAEKAFPSVTPDNIVDTSPVWRAPAL